MKIQILEDDAIRRDVRVRFLTHSIGRDDESSGALELLLSTLLSYSLSLQARRAFFRRLPAEEAAAQLYSSILPKLEKVQQVVMVF